MILRKPYAFFIKYFRVINLIMAVFMAVLLYRTLKIGNYLTSYIKDYIMASDGFVLGQYVNFYIYLLTFFVIILSVSVLSVMIVKKKPKKLYIFNLAMYIVLLILYIVDYNVMFDIYDKVLDVRISKALRDANYIIVAMQAISFIMTVIRATGFDIKGFDFNKDLQELEINVKDNEEFEVAVEFDQNKLKRGLRNKFRQVKYFYSDYKFFINIAAAALIAIIIFSAIITASMYSKNYSQNKIFTASTLQFNIRNSYLTTTDLYGKTIADDYTLVVVNFDVRKLSDDKKKLNTGLITLKVGKKSYGQTTKYNDYLTDIGVPYTNQKLNNEFDNYILIFSIPNTEAKKTKRLKINDNISYVRGQMGAKNNYVKLKTIDLTKKEDLIQNKIKDEVSFSGSLLGETNLTINSYEVANKFKSEYEFCSKKDKCVTSYEYITPTATGNYFKTLLKLDGEFEVDENTNLEIGDMFYFVNEFASIYYQIDGVWHNHKINSQRIKPKMSINDVTYIEVNKDVEKADSIYLLFNVRNYTYKYVLK